MDDLRPVSIYAEMNRRLTPWAVNLELTRRCNLACVHCYCTPSDRPELGTDEIRRVLDELAALGTMELTLTGGEPLLRRDFFDILDHAVMQCGYSVKIFSNLTLLDDAAAARLAAYPLNRVETTLLGPDALLHDRLSGTPGSFDATLTAIGRLKDRGIRVSAKTILMKGNRHRLHDIYALASTLGIGIRHDATLFVRTDGGRRPLGQAISARALRRYRRKTAYTTCNAARSVMSIDADGSVRPCGPFPRAAGNCREQSIAEIWRHSPLMNHVRSLTGRAYRACRGCPLELRCGGCIAMGMGLAGGRTVRCDAACGAERIQP